ncbi:PepSY domain-containing protein [Croceicoccus sp. YJ47]|uniref:PepSY-associated TM helix domain-containing protein n=1 Tax=Croceicoccus sp. YJ47 TaxID=2798724 RepID=UPI00192286D1|nr:PepSY-associated TM helix domain-containing protein [Croceicoccus sp. YJ47]QQN74329.1 PepSY domain-containing protein [Croceicoccus sp. YJ47]
MRAFLLLLHRYCGLVSLAFLAVAGLTGSLLVFRAPLDHALNSDLFSASNPVASTPLDTVAAIDAFQAAHPGLQVTAFPLRSDANRSIAAELSARPGAIAPAFDEVFLNPADGSVIGGRETGPGLGPRNFVAGVADLHFELLTGTPGRLFLGAIAVLWLLAMIAGLVLTTPEKGPFWKKWWRNWQFRRSSAIPRLLLDLHRASGLWLLPFLAVLAMTSIAFNFWSEAYEPAVTAVSPLEHDLFDQDAPFPQGAVPRLSFSDVLPRAEAHAEAIGLDWEPARMLYLPQWNLYGVKFSPHGELSYRQLGPVDHYFDGDTGEWRHQVDPYSDSAGLAMIRVVYPLHSGEIFGFASLALVFVLGLVTFGQSVTGLYIWWKKRSSRVARRKAAKQSKGSPPIYADAGKGA